MQNVMSTIPANVLIWVTARNFPDFYIRQYVVVEGRYRH